MAEFDLVVRGGLIYDGLGGAPAEGDIAVRDGRIAQVGKVAGKGREEIDARGHIVAPGWVDIHTHYDGQATWDKHIQPSSNMGVTTIIMGNCGVGFAPVHAKNHTMLIELMQAVEDIPGAALHEGLKWNWETFSEYLDALDAIPHDVDIGTQVPHAALRVYVMGERGANREVATEADKKQMRELVAEALKAGALGFSSSRTIAHRTLANEPIPTYKAGHEELREIAKGMAETGLGVMQYTTDNAEEDDEWGLYYELAKISGRPMSLSVGQAVNGPDKWIEVLKRIDKARAEGLEITGQVPCRAIGLLVGLQGSVHPFTARPSYMEIAHLPLAERVRIMQDPEFRKRVLAEKNTFGNNFLDAAQSSYERMFYLGDSLDYEPRAEDSVLAKAKAEGREPQEVVYDFLVSEGGRGFLYLPKTNYARFSLDAARTMLMHPATVNGLSDGGAHVGVVCDASMPTFLLTHWSRDRTRGEKLDLSYVIRRQTHDTAAAVGLNDRGVLKPGYRADINVIDYKNLRLKLPEMRYDLPTGAKRLFQEAEGYVATVVAGQTTYRDGKPTGALPGKVVRGARSAPAA